MFSAITFTQPKVDRFECQLLIGNGTGIVSAHGNQVGRTAPAGYLTVFSFSSGLPTICLLRPTRLFLNGKPPFSKTGKAVNRRKEKCESWVMHIIWGVFAVAGG